VLFHWSTRPQESAFSLERRIRLSRFASNRGQKQSQRSLRKRRSLTQLANDVRQTAGNETLLLQRDNPFGKLLPGRLRIGVNLHFGHAQDIKPISSRDSAGGGGIGGVLVHVGFEQIQCRESKRSEEGKQPLAVVVLRKNLPSAQAPCPSSGPPMVPSHRQDGVIVLEAKKTHVETGKRQAVVQFLDCVWKQ